MTDRLVNVVARHRVARKIVVSILCGKMVNTVKGEEEKAWN